MWCSRYKKECDEALYFSCDVPTSSRHIDEEIKECQECVFCDKEEEQNAGTLEH